MRKDTVLIFSNSYDITTNKVIENLVHEKTNKEIIRINLEDHIQGVHVDLNEPNIIFYSNDKLVDFSRIYSVWYRRGNLLLKISKSIEKNNEDILHYLSNEWHRIREFIFQQLSLCKITLGSIFHEIENNKIHNLFLAKEFSLKTPPTVITTTKKELVDFYRINGKIITKPISYTPTFTQDNNSYTNNGTHLVNINDIEELDDTFSPTCFQKYIDKQFEVRVFYLKGKLYSMAIFSQMNEKTKIDFRNYDYGNPNRTVPYQLPKSIEEKIKKILLYLKYDTCSIDIIYSTDNEYYFLEINPSGQFEWLSENCNYYIEKDIAKYLLNGKI